ncbi:Inner membrane protein YedI [Mycobacteriaceae bacterium]|jgi:predicted DNA repair protein MutK
MAGGLVGLLDDVAALAKLAAASVDDVGAAAAKASAKAAGVVIDDTAVTPAYVRGLAAERELPIIRRIAIGSLRNKLLIILPAALLLSAIAPIVVEIILMFGGCFLAYEGAHKIIHALRHDDHDHDAPAAELGPDAEAKTIAGAIRTDFILSAEIMVIALKEVIGEPVVSRGVILAVVGVGITVVVYGVVALIVKMDDVGLALAGRDSRSSQRLGRMLVAGMPKVLAWLSVIGTAAMLWVGGHILLVGFDELGWHVPYHLVHQLEKVVHGVPGLGGVLGWIANTLASALVGLVVGLVLVFLVERLPFRRSKRESVAHAD